MAIVTFYRGDPANAPKTTMPAHLGANAIITWKGKLLLERRREVPGRIPVDRPKKEGREAPQNGGTSRPFFLRHQK